MNKRNLRKVGNEKETLAIEYLKQQGFVILDRNYHTRFGELDIIAREGNYLCFIEVKYRTNQGHGSPEAAVNRNKIRQISNAALAYLMYENCSPDCDMRFDVIAIRHSEEGTDRVRLYRNAFEPIVS